MPFEQYCVEVLLAAVQPTLELLDIELATELELGMDEELLRTTTLDEEIAAELETTDELLAGCDGGSSSEEQEKSNEA